MRLLLEDTPIEEVMERTGRARSTVLGDLCELIEGGRYEPSLRLWNTYQFITPQLTLLARLHVSESDTLRARLD